MRHGVGSMDTPATSLSTIETGETGLTMTDIYDPFDRPPGEKRRRLHEQWAAVQSQCN